MIVKFMTGVFLGIIAGALVVSAAYFIAKHYKECQDFHDNNK